MAVKLHSGEPGNQNFLRPDFMKPMIDHVGGVIVECNTAYDGRRANYGLQSPPLYDKLLKYIPELV